MAGVPGMNVRLSTSPTYAAKVRARIKAAGIVQLLQKHVVGEREMSRTQIQAAVALLRKVVPDLHTVDGTMEHNHTGRVEVQDITNVDAARYVAFAMAQGAAAVQRAKQSGNEAAKLEIDK